MSKLDISHMSLRKFEATGLDGDGSNFQVFKLSSKYMYTSMYTHL